MALNGGVSLAVWMGGCAVELDCARRAHLAPETILNPKDRTPTPPERTLYNALCQAFDRALVVDLMSGSSAGGINGALLAAAIRHGRALPPDFVRQRWLDLGDLSEILHPTTEPSPESLMQGTLFHTRLLQAFEDLLDSEKTNPPPEHNALEKLDVALDVTATNLVGERRAFADAWDRNLVAREYRTRFQFREDNHYQPERLAAAARASASFPFAFEPWRATSAVTGLAGIVGSRWMIDGGVLDNAPIGAALDLIPYRPAHRQVRRYLCYLNADPPPDVEPELDPAGRPGAREIVGYVATLPRKAPFVDQLAEIERATRRIVSAGDTPAVELIALDTPTLEATALSLLGAYKRGRLRLSLEEVLDPAAAATVFREQPDGPFPWIPVDLDPLGAEGLWQWGLGPAERVLHLLIDVLRRAARATRDLEARHHLFTERKVVDCKLAAVVAARERFLLDVESHDSEVDKALEEAKSSIRMFDPLPVLEEAAAAVFKVRAHLHTVGPGDGRSVADQLFGGEDGGEDGEREEGGGDERLSELRFLGFLRRALAIEVVHRAFTPDAEVGSDQELRFVQLTPHSPGLVFTETPLESTGWATPEEKLTGVGLGHFAAFYRRSWRANDFMWGRLDAAARIVDMLVSPGRAKQLAAERPDATRAWVTLSKLLLPDDADDDRRWLIHEVLSGPADRDPPDGDDAADPPPPPPTAELLPALTAALQADLEPADATGALTRAICTRAVQLEILRHELPMLNRESADDEERGAGAKALDLPLAGGLLRPAIEKLRELPPPAERLTAPDEAASELALRTGAHAGLVSLGVLRTARIPLARALFSARALLLPIAGSVSRSAWVRGAVVAGFWAAALLVAANLIAVDKGDTSLVIESEAVVQAIVTLLALLVVVGVAFAPALRVWRASGRRRKWTEGAWAVGLLTTGALGAIGVGMVAGLFSQQLVAAAGGHDPSADKVLPTWLASLVIVFFTGGVVGGAWSVIRGEVNKLLARSWGGTSALVLVLGLATTVSYKSIKSIVDHLTDDATLWRVAIAALAAAAPLVAALYLRLLPPRRRST
jgi:hypothetical protein